MRRLHRCLSGPHIQFRVLKTADQEEFSKFAIPPMKRCGMHANDSAGRVSEGALKPGLPGCSIELKGTILHFGLNPTNAPFKRRVREIEAESRVSVRLRNGKQDQRTCTRIRAALTDYRWREFLRERDK